MLLGRAVVGVGWGGWGWWGGCQRAKLRQRRNERALGVSVGTERAPVCSTQTSAAGWCFVERLVGGGGVVGRVQAGEVAP